MGGRGAAREGAFLDDFLDCATPWWTIGANEWLSFLIIDPDKRITFYRVGRGGFSANSAAKGRKMSQNP